MMKSNNFDNAPTQSLLSVVNGILDESIERRNTEIPQRVACLLRKVVQEIERRLATQAQHLRMQNNLFKNREEKYQSRIAVLEALATGTSEENETVRNELRRLKSEKKKMEEKKTSEERQCSLGTKEKEEFEERITELKQELEMTRIALHKHVEEAEEQESGNDYIAVEHLKKEKEEIEAEISALKQQLDKFRKAYEQSRLEMENPMDNDDMEVAEVKNDMDERDIQISGLKKELDVSKRMYEEQCRETELQRSSNECKLDSTTLKQELETLREEYRLKCTEIEKQSENEEKSIVYVNKEADQNDSEISRLKKELESVKMSYEQRCKEMEDRKTVEDKEISQLKDQTDVEMSSLKQELEMCKRTCELRCQDLETGNTLARTQLEKKLSKQEQLLENSNRKAKEIEEKAELESKAWMRKGKLFQNFTSKHGGALQELRSCSESTKAELVNAQKSYLQELSHTGEKFMSLAKTAQKYHALLYENRKIYNELQDLKGNIRVYCRIRPFLRGQMKKDTIIDSIGDNGDFTIINPSKGKESQKSFKFNKVFAPSSTQAEVFTDTQPLVRTVLDGFNVCIFAYGQTGSGKTYTMMGPEGATEPEWGVNYRALADLFNISEERKISHVYAISVQMVEIYNEQILDLLSADTTQKKLGVLTSAQPNGIAVPDASMHTVGSTSDVIDLMNLGHANRTMSSTAMNERSSRSHSVVSIHVQGTDLKTGSTTHASLHLVDLAGSERIDRSEVTGDRLREAQHINKSLSALGDVIFALASKNSHVPYRNSKLTQVLQTSLGGRAKTLMFVQVNPDSTSYSESLSTLKFAERVSGVELGAARNNNQGKDSKELMDQVASLKDMIARKDEEIERLQLLKDSTSGKRSTNSLPNNGSHSPTSSTATDHEDNVDKNSDSGSTQLTDNDERLSEVSDGDGPGPDSDGTFEIPRGARTTRNPDSDKAKNSKLVSPRTRVPPGTPPSRLSQVKTTVRAATALKKAGAGTSSSGATPPRQFGVASSSPRTPAKRLG